MQRLFYLKIKALIGIALTYYQLGYAVLPENILGDENEVSSINSSKNNTIAEIKNINNTFSFNNYLGIVFRNLTLTGNGTKANVTSSPGYYAGLDANFKGALKKTAWQIGMHTMSSNYSGLSGISQNILSTNYYRFWASYSVKLGSSENQGFWLHGGYALNIRNATESTPIPLITSQITHGPRVGLNYSASWSSTWTMDARLVVSIPWFFSEANNASGSYQFGFDSDLYIGANYLLSKNSILSLGLQVGYCFRRFQGMGSRLTINTLEQELYYTVPLSFQITF